MLETNLKKAIWVYVALVLMEGALRRWVLPSLATPLLVIRDPVAIYILVQAIRVGKLSANAYILSAFVITVISFFTALLIGHGNVTVALFGARITLLHLPLIFVMKNVLNYDDVIKFGRIILWMAAPMTILVITQFYSPQSAWVNLGVAGDKEGAGFGGALGYFRPPGIFSFTNGLANFYGLLGAFAFYFLIEGARISRWLIILATSALLIAIPFTISRTVFFQLILSLAVFLAVSKFRIRIVSNLFTGAAFLFFAVLVLTQFGLIEDSISVFYTRFEEANESEGGVTGVLVDRFLGGMINAVSNAGDRPFFGFGIGMGSNVGAQLLAGDRIFLIEEQEWGKMIGELGTFLGLIYIFIRVSLVGDLFVDAKFSLGRNNALPIMLFSFSSFLLLQGNWSQPTALGFSIIASGFGYAASRKPFKNSFLKS